MNKDFSVKDFVKEYEKQLTEVDKDKFVKNHLKAEKYLLYEDKIKLAENIVKSSSYAIANEDGALRKTDVIAFNSPMRYILFVMTIVDKYTNIRVNFQDVMPEFNALNFDGLIEVIFKKIGDKEINEFNTILDMVLDDFTVNKYQFRNYISETISKISGLAEKCLPLIDNIINKVDNLSEEEEKKLGNFVKKITKFIK